MRPEFMTGADNLREPIAEAILHSRLWKEGPQYNAVSELVGDLTRLIEKSDIKTHNCQLFGYCSKCGHPVVGKVVIAQNYNEDK